MDVENLQTSIVCTVTGAVSGGSSAPSDGSYLTLTGTGDGWLVCNVVLMPDNTFTVSFDYNAENSGIQTDSGTWVLNDDGSIALTGDTRSFTATTTDGTNYTMDVENVETGIVCTVSGAVSGGSSAPSDGSYLTLTGTGDGWLVCNVVLMPDNTFTVSFDYNAENSGIQTDSGTWVLNDDGSIALTGDTRSFTATTTDGTNYTMDVENLQTSIVCTVTGAVSGGSSAPSDGSYLTLTGTGDGWLVCNVVLMPDNTFTVSFDYNAENSGIQTDSGTWVLNDDGSIALTGDTRSFTATTTDGTNYTMDVENVETGIVCTVSGAVSGGSSAPSDGSYLTLTGTGDGWLVCNVVLMPDNTFTVSFDYNAENSGIQTDSGTWVLNDDGSIALTGDTRSFTATTTDGTNYTMDVENLQTGIVCTVSGTANT